MDIKHDSRTFAVYTEKGHIYLEDCRDSVTQSLGCRLSLLRPTRYDHRYIACLSLHIPGLEIHASLNISDVLRRVRKNKT